MLPHNPQTKADDDGVLLVLDNGVRIESKSVDPTKRAGDYVLVVDRDGYEIGYWNAEEWADEPEQVMGAILSLAATGKPPPAQEIDRKDNGLPVPPGVPFVIEEKGRGFVGDTRKLEDLTQVGPKQSGELQGFEEKDKKK